MARRFIPFVMMLSALLTLGGCLMESTIDAKGGGVMTVKQRLNNEAQLGPTKKRFESAHVTLTSASIDKDKWATFAIKFDDVTKLSTAPYFADVTVSLADGEGGTKVLGIKRANKAPTKLPDEMVAYFGKNVTVSVTLPGEVVKSDATSTKDKTVTWTYPMNDFLGASEISMNATFKPGTEAGVQEKSAEKGAAEQATKDKSVPETPAKRGD